MALLTKQRKQQQLLIGVLALVVVITMGVLIFGTGSTPKIPPIVPPTGASIIPRVPIPDDLFIDRSFLELVPYDPISLPETIGKDNPFSP